MEKAKSKPPVILWVLIILLLLGVIGYFALWSPHREQAREQATRMEKTGPQTPSGPTPSQERTRDMKAAPNQVKTGAAMETKEAGPGQEVGEKIKEQSPGQEKAEPPIMPENDCSETKENLMEFFRYLDERSYIRHRQPEVGTYERFGRITRKLEQNLPRPAGEGIDPAVIIKNIYHLYRILDWEDVQLIKTVITQEQDTMELNLAMFYQWLCPAEPCPDPDHLRPSQETLYHYAGFFLNTTGGRAYLFRRSLDHRLLATYYCILLLHEADKKGKNHYGIDVSPHIAPLREEIELYPRFQLKNEYLEKLDILNAYYSLRR